MLPKSRIYITVEGWYYLIILVFVFCGALLRDINLLIAITGIMVGPVLVNFLLVVLTLRKLTFRRKLPKGVSVGDLVVAEIGVSNRRQRTASWAIVAEDRARRIGATRRDDAWGRVMFPYVASKRTAHVAYRGRIARRGRYQFGPLKVSTRFPFGLVGRTTTFDEISRITVYPRLGQLTPQWYKTDGDDRVGIRRSRQRQGLIEGEYYGLRDWRSGDSRRWIHWRTSAKRDQLTVRQFERPENQDLTLLLELWHGKRPSPRERGRVELAVSFVATVVADQCRRGSSQLYVAAAGKDIRSVSGAASMITMNEAMEVLAMAEADGSDRLPELLARALSNTRPTNRVIIVSTRATDLSDTDRFESVWDDPAKRKVLARVRCLDVNTDEFREYFRAE